MKSKYWLSICAIGALMIGLEIGGCGSSGIGDNPDAANSSPTGGTTNLGQAGETGSQGGGSPAVRTIRS
jgi:hypothetical protein